MTSLRALIAPEIVFTSTPLLITRVVCATCTGRATLMPPWVNSSPPAVSGEITADAADLAASQVTLTFQAGALKVLPEGEPAGDAPKVEEIMRGPKVLDAVRFPAITFKSQRVTGRDMGEAIVEHAVARARKGLMRSAGQGER